MTNSFFTVSIAHEHVQDKKKADKSTVPLIIFRLSVILMIYIFANIKRDQIIL